MKKTYLAAAALCVFASNVSAQSAVKLYGVVDQGLSFTKDVMDADNPAKKGTNQLEVRTGNLAFSRFGLRGSEDLGAGLNALFVLETNVSINNPHGFGNTLFGRQAFVGLASRDAGTVTLGRQFDAIHDYVSPFGMASSWAGSLGSHYGNFDTLYNQEGRRNTIKYASANYQGFSLGGTVSLGGQAGKISNGLSYSAGAGYGKGGWRVGAAYAKNTLTNNELDAYGRRVEDSIGRAHPNHAASQAFTTNAALSKKAQIIALGGHYTYGPARAALVFTNTKLTNTLIVDTSTDKNAALKTNNIEANLRYHATPALLLGIGYNYTVAKAPDSSVKIHQVTLGGRYDLSKRTAVYLTASGQMVKNGGPLRANLYGNQISTGDKQMGVRAGIRHTF